MKYNNNKLVKYIKTINKLFNGLYNGYCSCNPTIIYKNAKIPLILSL